MVLVTPEMIELAKALQAEGPDEFPFGYYLFLAEERLNEKGS